MIRATTLTHELHFEDGILADAVGILVSYKQDQIKRDVLWAGTDTNAIQVNKEEERVIVEWSQEDTRAFRANRSLMMQVRIIDSNKKAATSAIVETNVLQTLSEDLIGGKDESTVNWEWKYNDLTSTEIENLCDKLDIEAEDPDTWDTSMTADEAKALADKLGVLYTSGWDLGLSSVESAQICAKLGLINS